jgi:hypothetical protein
LELVVSQIAVLVIARGGQIGSIDLQQTGLDDGGIRSSSHRRALPRRHPRSVVQVDDEAREVPATAQS